MWQALGKRQGSRQDLWEGRALDPRGDYSAGGEEGRWAGAWGEKRESKGLSGLWEGARCELQDSPELQPCPREHAE